MIKRHTGKDKKKFGRIYEHKGRKIMGWTNPAKEKRYKQLASEIKNGVIVEIGVFGGASVLPIADICTANGNKIYGIDPWEKIALPNGKKMPRDELKSLRNGLKENRLRLKGIINDLSYGKTLELIHGFSSDLSIVNLFEDKSIDLVYIDGDHSYEAVKKDIELWLPKVKDGGLLSGDDFQWEGVKKAVHEFCQNSSRKLLAKKPIWEVRV